MNIVLIDGRIVNNTEKSSKNYVYQAAVGDPQNGGKQSYIHFLISTRKEGAPKDPKTGYYPTMLKAVKAFGAVADQINQNFGPGTYILLQGNLAQDEDFVGNDGATHRGLEYIKATRLWYGDFSGKSKDEQTETAAAPVRKATGKTLSRSQGIDSPF